MKDLCKIPLEILKLKDLTASAKLIYGRIYAFNPESCYMEINDFMEELNLTRGTVTMALDKLKEMKLVQDTSYKGLKAITLTELLNLRQPQEEI